MFQINGTDLLMKDLNIFCTTTANNRAVLEQLKQFAINNNTTGASIYDLGKIIQSDSIADVNNVLKLSEQKQQQQKQQEMEMQQKMQQEQIQATEKQKQMEIQAAAERDDKFIQKDITVAEIRAAGYGSTVDINQNQQSDFKDAMKEIRETEQYQEQTSIQREKQSDDMVKHSQKMNIEQQKLATQKEIADMQLQIAKTNKNKYDFQKPTKDKK
jgi:hypothetical protein